MAVQQTLGKVCITHKGTYNPLTEYTHLDVVLYQGSSYMGKYIATSEQTASKWTGKLPTDTDYWDLLVSKGDKGDKGTFLTPTSTTTTVTTGEATVTVTDESTTETEAKFKFDFGIPKGDTGTFASDQQATIQWLDPSVENPTITVTNISTVPSEGKFKFDFGIPQLQVEGGDVSKVDQIQAETSTGNVPLRAVSYYAQTTVNAETITEAMRIAANTNIHSIHDPKYESDGTAHSIPDGSTLVYKIGTSTEGWEYEAAITTAQIEALFTETA